ncbi:MAG: hypothetical protein GQF41_4359 [Candidatus Rifleibacterium amylolyticum]|nr:MAG: hypothetical protein GQF41_4359 [Candidatus Rifleibacterium amylolyticum]
MDSATSLRPCFAEATQGFEEQVARNDEDSITIAIPITSTIIIVIYKSSFKAARPEDGLAFS